jgi:hypothetical protein
LHPSAAPDLVLDVSGRGTSDGTPAILWTRNAPADADNQAVKLTGEGFLISKKASGKALVAQADGTIALGAKNASDCRALWIFEQTMANGARRIRNLATSMYLGTGGSPSSPTKGAALKLVELASAPGWKQALLTSTAPPPPPPPGSACSVTAEEWSAAKRLAPREVSTACLNASINGMPVMLGAIGGSDAAKQLFIYSDAGMLLHKDSQLAVGSDASGNIKLQTPSAQNCKQMWVFENGGYIRNLGTSMYLGLGSALSGTIQSAVTSNMSRPIKAHATRSDAVAWSVIG